MPTFCETLTASMSWVTWWRVSLPSWGEVPLIFAKITGRLLLGCPRVAQVQAGNQTPWLKAVSHYDPCNPCPCRWDPGSTSKSPSILGSATHALVDASLLTVDWECLLRAFAFIFGPQVYDLAAPPQANPLRQYKEHTHEVRSVLSGHTLPCLKGFRGRRWEANVTSHKGDGTPTSKTYKIYVR
jgi:hypothetical protein